MFIQDIFEFLGSNGVIPNLLGLALIGFILVIGFGGKGKGNGSSGGSNNSQSSTTNQ